MAALLQETKKDNVGLPQEVETLDGGRWFLVRDHSLSSDCQVWRYTERGVVRCQPMTLTALARYIGIRRVIRNAEGVHQ